MTKSEHESEKQASDNEESKKEKEEITTTKDKKRRPDVLYGKGGNKTKQNTKYEKKNLNENFIGKSLIFSRFMLITLIVTSPLEPPRQCDSNAYPQSMFWITIENNR